MLPFANLTWDASKHSAKHSLEYTDASKGSDFTDISRLRVIILDIQC